MSVCELYFSFESHDSKSVATNLLKCPGEAVPSGRMILFVPFFQMCISNLSHSNKNSMEYPLCFPATIYLKYTLCCPKDSGRHNRFPLVDLQIFLADISTSM